MLVVDEAPKVAVYTVYFRSWGCWQMRFCQGRQGPNCMLVWVCAKPAAPSGSVLQLPGACSSHSVNQDETSNASPPSQINMEPKRTIVYKGPFASFHVCLADHLGISKKLRGLCWKSL